METPLAEITLDKNKRLALGKVIKGKDVSSFEVFEVAGGYFLKPKVSVPAEEVWIFKNPDAKKKLLRGLSQEATHDLGSFARFADK